MIATSGDALHSVGFSVSYLEVLKFEKYAAVSSVKYVDFVSDSELQNSQSQKIDFGNS